MKNKEVKNKVLQIASSIYEFEGYEGRDLTFEYLYNSKHPTESKLIYLSVEVYNKATSSEWDVEELFEEELNNE